MTTVSHAKPGFPPCPWPRFGEKGRRTTTPPEAIPLRDSIVHDARMVEHYLMQAEQQRQGGARSLRYPFAQLAGGHAARAFDTAKRLQAFMP